MGRGLRVRGWRLTIGVLVVCALLTAALTILQKIPAVGGWPVAAGAALLAAAVPVWQRSREQRDKTRGVIRRSISGDQEIVDDVPLDRLRVHRAVHEVPYLRRPEKEAELADRLRNRRPVLVVGSSMVGKTRLASEVAKRVLGDRLILIPDSAHALADLDEANITIRDRVIWLDDLDRFLTGGALTEGLLIRLAASNWIVATLRAHEWERFQPTNDLRPSEWDVLSVFDRILLDRDKDRPPTRNSPATSPTTPSAPASPATASASTSAPPQRFETAWHWAPAPTHSATH